MSRPLPHDTETAATADAIRDCRNLGLLLDRFAPWEQRDEKWSLWMKVNDRGAAKWVDSSEAKGVWLRDSRGNAVSPPLLPSTHLDGDLIAQPAARWTALVRSQRAEPFEMKVDYRLVVGFGAEHVLETNLCLHRIYGFPIIPGSAVKGVTRAWKFWDLVEQLNVQEDTLSQLENLLTEGTENAQRQTWSRLNPSRDFAEWQPMSRDFYNVFGTTEQQGQVIFFDAYPTKAPTLKLDILNPHYGPYYSDSTARTPPADYLTPKPTYFLTVAKGSPFQFAVASKDSNLAAKAKGWLTCALRHLGIGGKTAAGYGFWEVRP